MASTTDDYGDWIKLHRKTVNSRVFSDAGVYHTWSAILLQVNWRTGYFKMDEIKPGQMAFSWRNLPERLHGNHYRKKLPSINTMRRRIAKLEKAGMVTVEDRNRQYSVLTVVKWAKYQAPVGVAPVDTPTDTPTDTDRRRIRKGRSTSVPSDKDRSEQQPSGFAFPVKGEAASDWVLSQAKLDEYAETYQDRRWVEQQLRQACQWLRDNPERQKTARGMCRYLSNWLSKENNTRGTGTPQHNRNGTSGSNLLSVGSFDEEAKRYNRPRSS